MPAPFWIVLAALCAAVLAACTLVAAAPPLCVSPIELIQGSPAPDTC